MLATFFALAFGISWGLLAIFLLFTAQAQAVFGPMGYTNPLFILAVYAPAIAAVIFLSGTPQSNWSLPGFFLGCVALSVILTPMFNASGGSLLVAALFHFQVNGPTWPDAQPWDSVIFAIVAVVVVVLNRKQMFDRDTGATEVLLDEYATPALPTQHA